MKNIENNEAIKNDAIQKITWLKFNEIVETKEPRGLFYTEEGDQYIGLNNTTGEAFAKDFNTLEECTQWLQRKINLDIQWIIDEQMDKCRDVLLNKNAEYGTEAEYFHNFNVAAKLQKVSLPQALAGMMAKHTSSVYDLCRDYGQKDISLEVWEEKITDHINYLLLLKAMVVTEQV